MHVSKRVAVATLSAAALAGSAATGVSALGNDRGGNGNHRGDRRGTVLAATLAPSMPSDPSLFGVAAGAAPWLLNQGEVRLRRDGRLRVRVSGLVIPSPPGDGTPGPVMTVSASLYCGNDTTAVGTTPPAPISRSGDARMTGQLSLPAKCLAPIVLLHPNEIGALYIAATGFAA
jgi:hypothetical protein